MPEREVQVPLGAVWVAVQVFRALFCYEPAAMATLCDDVSATELAVQQWVATFNLDSPVLTATAADIVRLRTWRELLRKATGEDSPGAVGAKRVRMWGEIVPLKLGWKLGWRVGHCRIP